MGKIEENNRKKKYLMVHDYVLDEVLDKINNITAICWYLICWCLRFWLIGMINCHMILLLKYSDISDTH